jgi:hypothetical protein
LPLEAPFVVHCVIVARTAWTAIAAITSVGTITPVRPRAARTAAKSAAIVIVALAHHGGRASLVLVDADRHEAENIFVNALLTLHFG